MNRQTDNNSLNTVYYNILQILNNSNECYADFWNLTLSLLFDMQLNLKDVNIFLSNLNKYVIIS